MANTAKNAIFKAKVNGALVEIFAKSNVQNVYLEDGVTTLAAKLTEIIADIASKASSADLTNGLAAKAEKVHTHAEGDITGLETTLATFTTTEAMNTALLALKQELLGDLPVEAYNTFTELAQYIDEHKEAADALVAAIGEKASKEEFNALKGTVDALGALAGKSIVTEDLLDETLKEKINASAQGNHSHSNKELLDTYDQTNADLKDAVAKKHGHENKTVLDGITEDTVTGWNAKSKVYVQSTEPAAMTDQDLWVQIVE